MIYNITFKGIVWDINEGGLTAADLELPSEDTIMIEACCYGHAIDDLASEEGGDWLSNKYGWCISSIGDVIIEAQ